MKTSKFPKGWDEKRVRRVVTHYESQSDAQAAVEDDAAYHNPRQAMVGVPVDLVPAVQRLIAGKQKPPKPHK